MNKKILSLTMAAVLVAGSLSGCSSRVVGRDAASTGLVSPLTQQEVLNYYAESMSYDTVVARNIDVHVNSYETTVVEDSDTAKIVGDALAETESRLMSDNYKATDESSRYLTDSLYNYIKAMLNDKKLVNGKATKIEKALGYYFVDKEYEIAPAAIGTFKESASLLGMNGSFHYNGATGRDETVKTYLINAETKLNDYYKENNISLTARFDENNNSFTISNGNDTTIDYSDTTFEPEITDAASINDELGTLEDTGVTLVEVPEIVEETNITEPTRVVTGSKNYVPRTSGIDLKEFNKIVGYGTTTSYIPNLDFIYNKPTNTGGIAGIGLYPSGGLGMSTFGFNREGLTGTCSLRYVFKEDLNDPKILSCTNIYVNYYEVTTGFNANNDNIIPDFLEREFSTLVERADRAIINQDIAGMINNNVFNDIGMAVLTGYQSNYSNVLRQISTLRRIISRDIVNNAYLVEIESYRQEGAKSSDTYASYKDQIYAVIEQQGGEFIITDYMTMNRQLLTEPDINPYAATAKRIVALGLTGEVSDSTKTEVTQLLNQLYTASTYRWLNGSTTAGDGTIIEKGMYDCFNDNVEMLPSTKKEEINSDLRSLLVKYGINTGATLQGKVTEWIGGSNDKQVELTTEELVTYQGRSTGIYMNCYYLVSCIEDKWVIDDLQILSQEEVSGDQLSTILDRLG